MNTLTDGNNNVLSYQELPLEKGFRKPLPAFLNSVPCVIFRKGVGKSIVNYLIKTFPEISYFEDVKEYAPTIIKCFVEHGMAVAFDIEIDHNKNTLIAIKEEELWDGAEHDLSQLFNLIRYTEDFNANDGNAFMDDYGLC